jgi:hypothetical protein
MVEITPMVIQRLVASNDVQMGDEIRAMDLGYCADGDRLTKVVGVEKLGVNVRIETDGGHCGLLPVNRGVTVWRPEKSAVGP